MAVVLISAKRVTNMKQIKKNKNMKGMKQLQERINPSNIPGRTLH